MLRPLARPALIAFLSSGLAVAAPGPDTAAPPSLSWFAGKPLAPDGLKGVDYAWIKPGLNLNGHSITLRDWDQPPPGSFSHQDITRMNRFSFRLRDAVKIALASSGKGKLLLGNEEDLVLMGRVLELKEVGFMGLGKGMESAAWDIALVDGRTREVLAGFHQKVVIRNRQDTVDLEDRAQAWADAWAANFIAAAWKPLPDDVMAAVQALPRAAAPAAPPPAPAPALAPAEAARTPVQELGADLERLDLLHRQGLLKDDEYEALRAQTIRKASSRP